MRLRRCLVRLAAVATLLGSAAACLATAPPAASAATTSVAGVAPTGSNDGWVRFAHLSPGTPAVDIFLYPFGNPGHPTILKNANYGSVSSYMAVSAGEYTVAMRPVGAPTSSPPVVSANFMVNAGAAYTVAAIGPSAAQRALVLTDRMAAPKGKALVRVVQASVKQQQVTVHDGQDVLAQQLAFGSATSYVAVQPGAQTIQFTASGEQNSMSVTLAGGSVHTIVVLDGSSGLRVDVLTDAAGSQATPTGGAGTGLGGMAPRDIVPALIPWVGTLAAGLLLVAAGVTGLRRSRRTAAVGH